MLKCGNLENENQELKSKLKKVTEEHSFISKLFSNIHKWKKDFQQEKFAANQDPDYVIESLTAQNKDYAETASQQSMEYRSLQARLEELMETLLGKEKIIDDQLEALQTMEKQNNELKIEVEQLKNKLKTPISEGKALRRKLDFNNIGRK